ncbi:hypothetical protein DYB28_003355 [Aphanomyces astaci]|uniref:3-hydroxyacyl-CoA dehydrogenase NAD binding domain-containing protein n=1 Tax=Aphanomyces astaci TaxID=112090 RepID=A0A9X8HC34_APHAT|nr:hypothetical protein DYB28_003355 [Aphanomyces astaci]
MRSAIAFDLAMHGVKVVLFDRDPTITTPDALRHASYSVLQPLWRLGYIPQIMVGNAVKNIRGVHTLEGVAEHAPQLIIEAIPEDLALKKSLLRELERLTSPTTILGTSSISLNVNDIAAGCLRPANFLGIRFMHPCVLIPFVELTASASTDPETLLRVQSYLSTVHKLCSTGPTRRVLNRSDVNTYQLEHAKALGFYHESLPMAKPVPAASLGHHRHAH